MKLEFVRDSPELIEFEKTLKYKKSVDYKCNEYGEVFFYDVHYQECSKKYYKVKMRRGIGEFTKSRYDFLFRREFLKTEPLFVNFHEVKPV